MGTDMLLVMGVYSVKSYSLLFEKTTGKRGFIRANGVVSSRSEPPGSVHSKNFPVITAKWSKLRPFPHL